MERMVGDTRLSDAQVELFRKKVDCQSVDLGQVGRFINTVLMDKLDTQDDLVVDFVKNMIEEASRKDIVPEPLNALEVGTNLTGFIGDEKSIAFLEHLWPFLVNPPPPPPPQPTRNDKIIPMVVPSTRSAPRDGRGSARFSNPKYSSGPRGGAKRRWQEGGDRRGQQHDGRRKRQQRAPRRDSAKPVPVKPVSKPPPPAKGPVAPMPTAARTPQKEVVPTETMKAKEEAIKMKKGKKAKKEKKVKKDKKEKKQKKEKKEKKEKKKKHKKDKKERQTEPSKDSVLHSAEYLAIMASFNSARSIVLAGAK